LIWSADTVFVAALITAVPCGLAHWPFAFFGDVTVASAAVRLAGYLVLGVIFRPLLGAFLRGTRDSVLLVVRAQVLQPHQQQERYRRRPPARRCPRSCLARRRRRPHRGDRDGHPPALDLDARFALDALPTPGSTSTSLELME
jgi:hypothetical protein